MTADSSADEVIVPPRLIVILFVTASGSAAVGQSRLLVKFRPGTAAGDRAAAVGAVGGTVEQAIPDIGVQVVSVPSAAAAGALAHLRAAPNVAFAEPDATAEAADVPDDPSFSLQWGMNKIKAPDAWTTNTGSPSVKVAVLDTGVSLSHPDLQGKIVASRNFSSSSTLDDVNGHGSHVAGIAAAATNNAVGVAGVGYSVDIMNVKVLGDSGSGLYSNMCSGIKWAADNGADVINLRHPPAPIRSAPPALSTAGGPALQAASANWADWKRSRSRRR